MTELPKNLSIEPVTQFDPGDLGSISNYRTNNTLNRIENRVMQDMQARNKQMVNAIKQDPSSTNSLLLTLGQGLSEQRTSRELADLRSSVRESDVSRARAKQTKARDKENVKVIEAVIKELTPDLKGRVDPNKLLVDFVDKDTGTVNYQVLGAYLQAEDEKFQKNRTHTPKSIQATLRNISANEKLIKENSNNPAYVKFLNEQNDKLKSQLKMPDANITFTATTGKDMYVRDAEYFGDDDARFGLGKLDPKTENKGHYKTKITIDIEGQPHEIILDRDSEPPKLEGNTLVLPTLDLKTGENVKVVLSKKQAGEFRKVLNQAVNFSKQKFSTPQGFQEIHHLGKGGNQPQVQTGDQKKPLSLVGPDSVQAEEVPGNKTTTQQIGDDVRKRLDANRGQGMSSSMPNWDEDLTGDPAFPAQRPMTREDSARNSANYDKNIGQDSLVQNMPNIIDPNNPVDPNSLIPKNMPNIIDPNNPVDPNLAPKNMPSKITQDVAKALGLETSIRTPFGGTFKNVPGAEGDPDATTQTPFGGIVDSAIQGESYSNPNMPRLTKELIGNTSDGRPIWKNEPEVDENGGSWDSESSERATILEVDGKFYPYPTLFNRRVNGELEPYEVTEEEAKQIFIKNKGVDPDTGNESKAFATKEEAMAFAKERSSHLSDHLRKGKDNVAKNADPNSIVKSFRGSEFKTDKVKSSPPSQVVIDRTLERDPASTYSRADADRDQAKIVSDRKQAEQDVIREEIEKENLARVQKQMERGGLSEGRETPIDEKVVNALDAIRNAGNKNIGADVAEASVPPKENESDVAREIRRRNLIRVEKQDALGKPNVDEPSMLGKATGWIGDKLESASTSMDNAVGSAQDQIVSQAKQFMKEQGANISESDAGQWAIDNWQAFNKWRKDVYGPDKAPAYTSSKVEKIQSDKMKSGIDKPYLQSATDRNSKGVFRKDIIPEGTPYADNFRRGITLAGRNGKAKDVRPAFMVALAGTENAKFDPKAEGIEKNKKTGQNVPGGKVQGLGLVQMTVDTAKGTDLGKLRFKGKSDQEIAKMLKGDPDLNIAISTQFVQKLFNVFKRNEYTKKFKPLEMEMLVGIAYNNSGESFKNVVNRIKPKNLKDLLHKVNLEEQTRRHIPRLKSNLNKQLKTPRYTSGKAKEKSILQTLKDTPFKNKQVYQ